MTLDSIEESINLADLSSEEEELLGWTCAKCKLYEEEPIALTCRSCTETYHPECVGEEDPSIVPRHYICPACVS